MKVPEYMQEAEKRERRGKWVGVAVVALCVVNAAALVVGLYGMRRGEVGGREMAGWDAAQQRALAAKLLTEGMRERAIEAFEKYLAMGGASSSDVANVSYLMGKANMELQRYEEALACFYRAELADGGSKAAADARRAVIVCLERMGRMVDARYALDKETALRRSGVTQEVRGVVVAKIGDEEITAGDVHDYIQRLPEREQKRLDTAQGRDEVLRQMVMERLLYKKGQLAGLDRDGEVRRQVAEVERQLVVQRVVKEELGRRVQVDEADVRNYFEANKGKFEKRKAVDGGTNEVVETPRFEVVRSEVERAYRAEKEQRAMEELMGELMKAYRVEVYAERLREGK